MSTFLRTTRRRQLSSRLKRNAETKVNCRHLHRKRRQRRRRRSEVEIKSLFCFLGTGTFFYCCCSFAIGGQGNNLLLAEWPSVALFECGPERTWVQILSKVSNYLPPEKIHFRILYLPVVTKFGPRSPIPVNHSTTPLQRSLSTADEQSQFCATFFKNL